MCNERIGVTQVRSSGRELDTDIETETVKLVSGTVRQKLGLYSERT